ncbi:hypothetical protein D3C78_1133910 [compost metagenome]
MEAVVDHQGGGRGEGDDVALWAVVGQVEQPFAHHQRADERQARLVGRGAAEVDQAQLRRGGQAADQRTFRGADEERGVQLASEQGAGGLAAADGLPALGVLAGVDAVGVEDGAADRRGAAAGGAQAQAQRQQVAHAAHLQRAPLEQPQGFLVGRPEGVQLAALGFAQLLLQAALHQADLYILVGVEEQAQVFPRAAAGHQGQFETLLGQLGLELLGEAGVAAAGRATGHAGVHRRRRGDEVEQRRYQRGQHRHQPQVGAQHDGQVLKYPAHRASRRGSGCSIAKRGGCEPAPRSAARRANGSGAWLAAERPAGQSRSRASCSNATGMPCRLGRFRLARR